MKRVSIKLKITIWYFILMTIMSDWFSLVCQQCGYNPDSHEQCISGGAQQFR